MATTSFPSHLAFWAETTPGTGPDDAAQWASEGVAIRHMDLDLSSLVQSMIDDERSQSNVLDHDPRIQGIKGSVSFPHGAYLHGSADAPADGVEVAEPALATQLAHAMGGIYLGTSDALVAGGAHTTTAIELTDTLPDETWVGLVDANGDIHRRQVVSSSAGSVGQVHTLHRALPFTPVDAAVAYGCVVLTFDEDSLEDSGVGGTMSWLGEKGRGNQRTTYEMRGCVSSLDSISLGRNAVAKVSFTTLVGSFSTPEEAPVPDWSGVTPSGNAGRAIGPRTQVWIANKGVTTNSTLSAVTFEVTPGVTRKAVEAVTEDDDGMPGIAHYTFERARSELKMQLATHADGNLTDFNNGQEKSIQFDRNAPVGASWSVYLPRATPSGTPTYADSSGALGQMLGFDCLQDDDATTTRGASRIQIILC